MSDELSKRELFSSEDDADNDDEECSTSTDERVELLDYERNVMLDTFSDDVLFILAKGLGLERLVLHHLHLYSDPKLLVFIVNTTPADECYFISNLKEISKSCLPRVINSDVSTKDREILYMQGGIHFITSRILMVDLLQNRVPVKNVAGIIVHHAHQLLSGFQESFILRLYREKKADGFVKAFSDNPNVFTSIGELQRLVSRLYIRRVRLLPRFDVDVKRALDLYTPKMIEMCSDLPHSMRKVQSALVDIIRTCVNELKQCSTGFDIITEEESSHPSSGLNPSMLEIQLKCQQFSLTEKQQRLLNDLKQLRNLLYQAEELDAATLYRNLLNIRRDKDLLTNNSGWIFTQTASKLFIEIEQMYYPKWSALKSVLEEIRITYKARRKSNLSDSPIVLIGGGREVCFLIRDLIKWGLKRFKWVKRSQIISELTTKSNSREPQAEPLWDPDRVILSVSSLEDEQKNDIVTTVKADQKLIVRRGRKRRKLIDEEISKKRAIDNGQTRLVQFGIVQYKRLKEKAETNYNNAIAEPNSNVEVSDEGSCKQTDEPLKESDPLLLIIPHGEKYSILRQLKCLAPNFVILYHSDLTTLRLLEIYKACNVDHDLFIYVLMYRESNEEERYLYSLRNEQLAFEQLVREQGSLLIPREYDTARETTNCLNLAKSSRNAGGRIEPEESENPKIIIDMREFNCELPTILYKRGIDLVPATLEVGDYILAPDVAVERKALDDLVQSLHSGRIFKQIEQMLRHYENVILLIESNKRDNFRKITGGPFQGELSRRCRETRGLFTILVRTYPQLNVVWTMDPTNSAEMFEEFKLNKLNPDVNKAIALRSDVENIVITEATGKEQCIENLPKVKRFNSVLQRQLARLPSMNMNDVVRLMSSDKVNCLLDIINADMEKIFDITNNETQAATLYKFFSTDFREEGV
ncbi:unnamed protein product [Dracunculus medinensis]|uniref:DNA repair endonuclease XPF n=1 Tax=Dracunculus medinensis TaxID=318479 RepID=A0A0N4U2U1_DRAME|nr:unnamed protein product [Dracunculus medinensis]